MQLLDNNIEYRDQLHEMWVEGMSDEKPIDYDILRHASKRGYYVNNIDVWYDELQSIWRYIGNLEKI